MRTRFLSTRIQISDLFTAKGLTVRALVLVALFSAAHLAGWRTCTSMLSGTYAAEGISQATYVYLGATYIVLYLGAAVAAPIMIIAAGLLMLFAYIWKKRTTYGPSDI